MGAASPCLPNDFQRGSVIFMYTTHGLHIDGTRLANTERNVFARLRNACSEARPCTQCQIEMAAVGQAVVYSVIEQYSREYLDEYTAFKVFKLLTDEGGLDGTTARNAITAMRNGGILFRERGSS